MQVTTRGRTKNFEVIWPVLSWKPETKFRESEEVLASNSCRYWSRSSGRVAEWLRIAVRLSSEPGAILLSSEPESALRPQQGVKQRNNLRRGIRVKQAGVVIRQGWLQILVTEVPCCYKPLNYTPWLAFCRECSEGLVTTSVYSKLVAGNDWLAAMLL